jgi:hypothetical protein
MQYVYLACSVAAVATGFFLVYRKRAREAPLRKVVKSHTVTYMTSVQVNKRDELSGAESEIRGPMSLIIRTEFIEISCPIPFLAAAFGMEFYFPAAAVAIETDRSRWGREWIRLTGESAGKVIHLSIANRKNMREIWDALAAAGTVATGDPPVS